MSGKDLCAWNVDSNTFQPRVHKSHGVVLFAQNRKIDPLGRWIYYLKDRSGDEIGHLYRVPFEGGDSTDLTPNFEDYSLVGLGAAHNGSSVGLVAVNQQGFQLVVLDPSEPEPKLLHSAHQEFVQVQLSANGSLAAVMSTEWTGNRHYGIKVFDCNTAEQVAELWQGPDSNFHICGFSPDRPALLCSGLSEHGRHPIIWEPSTGSLRRLATENLGREVTGLDWSEDGNALLLSSFVEGVQTLHLYCLESEHHEPIQHPPGAFGEYGGTYARFAYFGAGRTVYAHRQNSRTPLRLEKYQDRGDTEIVLGSSPVQARSLSGVTFPSLDGTRVQAWLGVPEGEGPFPTIINVHGGPHLVQTESFCPASQAWMERGFCYLSINYRGSTTFGASFQEAIWGQIGKLELADMVAGRDFLVEKKLTKPEAIFLNGESYGGFLTLWALAKRPDLWAGGMAAVALTDWTETYRDASEALQGAFRNWFGGSPETVPELYKESSPLHLAHQIEAPVLLFQGLYDSRTPPRQADLFSKRMKEAGHDLELHWFEGGHALDTDRKVELQELMMKFTERLV